MKNPFKRHQEQDGLGSDLAPDEDVNDQSFQSQPGSESRTMYVEYADYWNQHTTISVLDTDKTTTMYTVDARYRKPQMRIHSNTTNAEVATVDFHSLTTRMDLKFRGQPLTLESSGFMATQHWWASPELGGEKMTWKPRSKIDDLNIVLLDGQGIAIARYKPNYKSMKRGGSLEMLAPCWRSEALMEEVIVMLLAVVHYKESQRMSATLTATASA
ncbi:hypothetical protein AYO21_03321 [Fonsecaea monophora]|uniref:DUF6593 domain-containing protein n=1 Tax=Fonsecaea monophora TaxID=254056 RepID=A0A177FDX6_9EURO|nr:hypothetical protein AYO21_03321 [Fonsecaea monophora]KAH0842964.1 hypothetical protein FOPE_08327 [Fonsecaea pedrosoi]OAG42445.1 hypothetical protein AYO21_03321 [Fonsecaea monophora]